MTDRTVNVEPLLPAFEQRPAQLCLAGFVIRSVEMLRIATVGRPEGRFGNLTDKFAVYFALIKGFIVAESTARNRPLDRLPRGEADGEKIAGLERFLTRLVIQVEPIATRQQDHDQCRNDAAQFVVHGGTS
jgi:hypothetical protein